MSTCIADHRIEHTGAVVVSDAAVTVVIQQAVAQTHGGCTPSLRASAGGGASGQRKRILDGLSCIREGRRKDEGYAVTDG